MKKTACLLFSVATLNPAQAAINLFDTPNTSVTTNLSAGVSNWSTSVYNFGSVATTRTVSQFGISGSSPATSNLRNANPFGLVQGRELNMSNGGDLSYRCSVVYGSFGPTGSPGAQPDMNLNLGNLGDGFRFVHSFSEFGVPMVTISIYSNGVLYSAPAINLASTFGNKNDVYNVPFSAFPSSAIADMDWLSFDVVTPSSNDMAIANFEIIPEPSSVVLLSFAGGACTLRRRR